MKNHNVIPGTNMDLAEAETTYGIDERLVANIRKQGMNSLFPVQVCLLPKILDSNVLGGDTLVRAPTGSGKTLAYALPIVNTLLKLPTHRLRALVIVPTRDLVQQVDAVFTMLCAGTSITVTSLHGKKSFRNEHSKLIDADGPHPTDILVSTPGRLLDHLLHLDTPLSLASLMFLVIDEADRLLFQSYQNWVERVLAVLTPQRVSFSRAENDPIFKYPRLQKILLSATLSSNPERLEKLHLVSPTYYVTSTEHLYALPVQLKQHLVVCPENLKPMVLVDLLRRHHSEKTDQTLCFTASLDSAHRLSVAMEILNEELKLNLVIREYSANLNQEDRDKLLSQFRNGRISVLVCSDVISRGLDIDNVQYVVNYDVPTHVSTYVHRVGRTARAGRSGTCFTICRKEEVRHLKDILVRAENANLSRLKPDYDYIREHEGEYSSSLAKLEKALKPQTKQKSS